MNPPWSRLGHGLIWRLQQHLSYARPSVRPRRVSIRHRCDNCPRHLSRGLSRLLKKSATGHDATNLGRFSCSLVELKKMSHDGGQSSRRKPRAKNVFQQPVRHKPSWAGGCHGWARERRHGFHPICCRGQCSHVFVPRFKGRTLSPSSDPLTSSSPSRAQRLRFGPWGASASGGLVFC